MAKGAGALLLLAGGAALLLVGGKKKKKAGIELADLPGGDDCPDGSVYDPVTEKCSPIKKSAPRTVRTNPPNPAGGAYDHKYWDKSQGGGGAALIRSHLNMVVPPVPINETPMNNPGPDGKLGGGDDVPNATVRRFQSEYNGISRLGKSGAVVFGQTVPGNMGTLSTDGYVGPKTLNALKFASDHNLSTVNWAAAKKEAEIKGYLK